MENPHSLSSSPSFFGRSRSLSILVFIVVVALGAGVRLAGLNLPSLSSAGPTPYFRELILQTTSRLAWLAGGIALFGIARKLASLDGALLALAFFLLTPFGVSTSGSDLPDSLMVACFLVGIYILLVWSESPSRQGALLAGIALTVAVFLRSYAVIPAVAVFISFDIITEGLTQKASFFSFSSWKKYLFEKQAWAILLLILAGLVAGALLPRLTGYDSGPLLSLSRAIITPAFYIRWLDFTNHMLSQAFFFAALAGVVCFAWRGRLLASSLWIGYLLLGVCLSKLVLEDLSYSLVLFAAISLSLASLGDLFFGRLTHQPKSWQALFAAFSLLVMAYPVWLIFHG
jgi:hypothetical protein